MVSQDYLISEDVSLFVFQRKFVAQFGIGHLLHIDAHKTSNYENKEKNGN